MWEKLEEARSVTYMERMEEAKPSIIDMFPKGLKDGVVILGGRKL